MRIPLVLDVFSWFVEQAAHISAAHISVIFSICTEHVIPEIRTRAINNVQSKFQSCRTDLQDLTVDVNDLIKRLLNWFELKPVTNAKIIFEILLSLLKVNIFPLFFIRVKEKKYLFLKNWVDGIKNGDLLWVMKIWRQFILILYI